LRINCLKRTFSSYQTQGERISCLSVQGWVDIYDTIESQIFNYLNSYYKYTMISIKEFYLNIFLGIVIGLSIDRITFYLFNQLPPIIQIFIQFNLIFIALYLLYSILGETHIQESVFLTSILLGVQSKLANNINNLFKS
jgi:hypothetical protein